MKYVSQILTQPAVSWSLNVNLVLLLVSSCYKGVLPAPLASRGQGPAFSEVPREPRL